MDLQVAAAPRVSREPGPNGVLGLRLDHVHDPVVVGQRATEDEEARATKASMNAACPSHPDCSSIGRSGSHSGPDRRSVTRNIAIVAF